MSARIWWPLCGPWPCGRRGGGGGRHSQTSRSSSFNPPPLLPQTPPVIPSRCLVTYCCNSVTPGILVTLLRNAVMRAADEAATQPPSSAWTWRRQTLAETCARVTRHQPLKHRSSQVLPQVQTSRFHSPGLLDRGIIFFTRLPPPHRPVPRPFSVTNGRALDFGVEAYLAGRQSFFHYSISVPLILRVLVTTGLGSGISKCLVFTGQIFQIPRTIKMEEFFWPLFTFQKIFLSWSIHLFKFSERPLIYWTEFLPFQIGFLARHQKV